MSTVVPLPESDAELLVHAGFAPDHPAEAGLFEEGGWLRRVSGEPAVLFGGVRALLLEVAHPLVAAGVAAHSDFRRDPFARLQRTLDAVNALAFAPRDQALAAARGVARSHGRVTGSTVAAVGRWPRGVAYHGRDPDLVLWVWATLADTALAVYREFVGPLDARALDEYHRDHRRMALLLGAPADRTPGDAIAFRTWFDGVLADDTLCVGDEAREIAAAVLSTPATDRGPVSLVTAALLPARLREAFGIAWKPESEARYRALVASVRRLRGSASRAVDGRGGGS